MNDFHYHIEAKSFGDMTGRYRLLPCVLELLKKTSDVPKETEHGNLMLEGMTPQGEKFQVIIFVRRREGVVCRASSQYRRR